MFVGNNLLEKFHNLCSNAKRRFWVISPFLGNWNELSDVINLEIFTKQLDFKLLTDINNINGIDKETLIKFLNVGSVKTLDMLHAKIYVIDDECLITSANFSKTAFCKRYEIGEIINFNNEIESILKLWWEEYAKEVNLSDVQSKNYKYYQKSEIGNIHNLPPILWTLLPQKNNTRINGKITPEMTQQAYAIARDIYKKEMPYNKGRTVLCDKFEMNIYSATIYIENLKYMLDKGIYKQTMNQYATRYYLENIYKDFGEDNLIKAISSYKEHVKYYRNLEGKRNTLSYAEDLIATIQNEYSIK